MCKVKSGLNLKTESDLQNLITGIILRQQHSYFESDIMDTVEYHCGVNQIVSRRRLQEMIGETLDLFAQYKKVDCVDGLYTPKRINVLSLRGECTI